MSTEEPQAPSEPPPVAAPPERPTAPESPYTSAREPFGASNLKLLIAIAIIALVGAGVALVSQNNTFFSGGTSREAYSVQPYTPRTEIIAARERVEARAAPDEASPIVVVFGQGATINVTGRVSRGLGNDWYAVSWNERTAFVRQQDAVAGSGAPPTPDVREQQPEEEEDKPDVLEEEPDVDEDVFAEEQPSRGGTLEMSDVNWLREPSARDFARYYPDDALDDGRSGRVVLDCVIGGGGRLDCSVANESPSGNGFGQAAISISRQVRVAPTLPDGSPAAGRHMRMPLAFRAG